MNFKPESGYETALGILRQVYIPTRDKNEPQPPISPYNVPFPTQQPNAGLPYSQSGSQGIRGPSSHEPSLIAIQPVEQALQPLIHASELCIKPKACSTGAPCAQTIDYHNPPQLHRLDGNPSGRYLEIPSSSVHDSPLRSHESSTSIPLPVYQTESRSISTSHGRLEQRSEPLHNGTTAAAYFASRPMNKPLEKNDQSHIIMGPPAKQVRPFTSPTWDSQQDTLAQLHPPRRILPFPTIQSKSREADPIKDDLEKNPRQRKPQDAAAQNKTKGTKGKAGARKSKALNPVTKSASQSAKRAKSSASAHTVKVPKFPSSSAPVAATKSVRSPEPKKPSTERTRKASPIVEEDLGNSSDQPPSLPPLALPKNKPSTVAKIKEARAAAPSGPVTESFMEGVDDFVRRHAPRPAAIPPSPAPISDLQEYAKIPESKRLEALDELIMKYIDDDNFKTLCQDVEKSWKRIGLNG